MLELSAAIVKALGYAAALSGAGTVLVRATLPTVTPSLRAVDALIRTAGSLLAVCTAVTALLFVLRLGGGWDPSLLRAIFFSPLGAALALQIAGGLWLLATAGHRGAAFGALLILLSFGVVGHSATRGLLTSATVVTHVAAAAWWLGGIWTLLLANRRLPLAAFSELVSSFSRQATWVVVVLVAAALCTAVLLLDSRFDMESDYLRGLLAKIGMTTALLALAIINRLLLSPRLAPGHRHLRWLRRSMIAELVVMACILSVTAWLTTWQSP